MKSIAAKAIKTAIADGKNVELVETIVSVRKNNRYHHQAFIDGTEYSVSTRSFNDVRLEAKSSAMKCEGIATIVRFQF